MTVIKPLLLLDVDGVLNPFGGDPQQREQQGYLMRKIFAYNPMYDQHFAICYSYLPQHAEFLRELSQHFQLAWCTSWGEDANKTLSPLYNLPLIGDVGIKTYEPDVRTVQQISHKTEKIVDYVGNKPFAWVDDIIREADVQLFNQVLNQPHLPYLIEPTVGLREKDVDNLIGWATSL